MKRETTITYPGWCGDSDCCDPASYERVEQRPNWLQKVRAWVAGKVRVFLFKHLSREWFGRIYPMPQPFNLEVSLTLLEPVLTPLRDIVGRTPATGIVHRWEPYTS